MGWGCLTGGVTVAFWRCVNSSIDFLPKFLGLSPWTLAFGKHSSLKKEFPRTWIDLHIDLTKGPFVFASCAWQGSHCSILCLQGSPVWWGTKRVFSPGKDSPKLQHSSWRRGTGDWQMKREYYPLGPNTPARSDTHHCWATQFRTGSVPCKHYALWKNAGKIQSEDIYLCTYIIPLSVYLRPNHHRTQVSYVIPVVCTMTNTMFRVFLAIWNIFLNI